MSLFHRLVNIHFANKNAFLVFKYFFHSNGCIIFAGNERIACILYNFCLLSSKLDGSIYRDMPWLETTWLIAMNICNCVHSVFLRIISKWVDLINIFLAICFHPLHVPLQPHSLREMYFILHSKCNNYEVSRQHGTSSCWHQRRQHTQHTLSGKSGKFLIRFENNNGWMLLKWQMWCFITLIETKLQNYDMPHGHRNRCNCISRVMLFKIAFATRFN